ncbi:HK97-gp10 family putative phage morphogenesis protein [Priestia endophytica]|uniref:HK97-gp10 family putative phage morphogenesis protein n=1 Tax=Priestia endophytica TaxID=135735 RepID=UPI00203AD69B|nr:HK97-gp10 family putative phage morphogenesis protein [Priestia endophytica]MCM3536593.1 HK97 gp10 family phage protein [Priestia endophytica]
MPIQSTGFDELRKRLMRLQRIEENELIAREALKAGALVLKKEIEKRAPRSPHTGEHLADHVILSKIFHKSIDVGFHKDFFYARFLELGTSKMPPQPFVEPAYNACKEQIMQAMMRVYERELNRL